MHPKTIKFLKNSKTEMAFTNKTMTSYGGFSLLAKLFEKIEFRKNLESIFPVNEISPNSKGIYSKLLKFGLTVIAGGKRFTHSIFLGNSDKIYSEIFDVTKMVKSSTAITRLFNKINNYKLSACLSENLWTYIMNAIIPFHKLSEDFLNFDSKIITRYGKQEGVSVGYNPKKKGRASHHPLMAFLNKHKYVVNLWNRDGSSSSGNGVVSFLEETLSRLDGKITLKGCIGDSGFYNINFIKKLENYDLSYIIGVPFHEVIQRRVPLLFDWEEIDIGISISEFIFQHKDEKWEKNRRYVIVRQEIKKKENARGKQLNLFKDNYDLSKYRYSCFITSLSDSPLDVWRMYRARAADENVIKENTYDFGLEGFALDNFYATESAMLIRVLFYNIINFFRREILPSKESGETLGTLRYKYFVIPALLGKNGHKYVLRLGVTSKKLRTKIKWIISKIDEYFDCISNALHLKIQT